MNPLDRNSSPLTRYDPSLRWHPEKLEGPKSVEEFEGPTQVVVAEATECCEQQMLIGSLPYGRPSEVPKKSFSYMSDIKQELQWKDLSAASESKTRAGI
mmetsp:Transcript_4945/g.10492  ORF Transcript_4945/g.10492 Transcript_4945/m.10492 type:complete len:99 (-) Transcript_4945:4-300(-)